MEGLTNSMRTESTIMPIHMFELYSRKERNHTTSDEFHIRDRLFSIRIPESGSGFRFIYIKCDTGNN